MKNHVNEAASVSFEAVRQS